jgi:drug/metabolite transporter (DMT)-like permease
MPVRLWKFHHGISGEHPASVGTFRRPICESGGMPSPVRHRNLGFAACGAAGALWGTGFFFGKIALAEMSVGHMVFYRFFFAIVAMVPLLILHRPQFGRRDWSWLLLGSFLGVPVQFLLQFKGLSLTTVAHAALMVGTMPVILAAGAAVFAHERMDLLGWFCLAFSTVGATLIALGATHSARGGPTVAGDLLVVLSLCIALFWILINKRLMARHTPITVTAWGLLAGFAMLAVWTPMAYGMPPIHGISTRAWMALAASGVLCTASTTMLWNWGMQQVPASQAGVFLNLEPLMGSLLGIFLLHETLGASAWVGGAMIVLAAVVLTTRSSTRVGTEELSSALVTE